MSDLMDKLKAMSPEMRLYTLQFLPRHLADAGRAQRSYHLLTSIDFIEAKCAVFPKQEQGFRRQFTVYDGIFELLEDYGALIRIAEYSPELLASKSEQADERRQILRLLQSALRSEGDNCANWPMIVGQQLRNALAISGNSLVAHELITKIEQVLADRVWLKRQDAVTHMYASLNLQVARGEELEQLYFTPDGKNLLAATQRHWYVWSIETGKRLAKIDLDSSISAAAISPDGNLLALTHGNGNCSLWKLLNGNRIGNRIAEWSVYAEPNHPYISTIRIAFSSDSKLLATLGLDGLTSWIRVWDVFDQSKIAENECNDGIASFLKKSAGATSTLWRLDPARTIALFNASKGISFCIEDEYIFAASAEVLQIWNWKTDKVLWRLELPFTSSSDPVGLLSCVTISDDRRLLIVGDMSGVLHLWDLTEQPKKRFTMEGRCTALAARISRDKSLVLAVDKSGDCYIWRISDGRQIGKVSKLALESSLMDLSPDGKFLLVGSKQIGGRHMGLLYDLDKIRWSNRYTILNNNIVTADLMDGDQRVILGDYGTLVQLEFSIGKEIWRNKVSVRCIRSITCSRRNGLVACGGDDGICTIWHPPEKDPIAVHSFQFGCIVSVQFSRNSEFLAIGTDQGYCILWKWGEGRKSKILTRMAGKISALALSSDDRLLAVASDEGECSVWDISKKRKIRDLSGHTAWITCIAFAPNNSMLATGSFDRSVLLWDLSQSEAILPAMEHDVEVYSVNFYSSGKILLTTDNEGTCRLWSTQSGHLLTVYPVNTRIIKVSMYKDRIKLVTANGILDELSIAGLVNEIQYDETDEMEPTRCTISAFSKFTEALIRLSRRSHYI